MKNTFNLWYETQDFYTYEVRCTGSIFRIARLFLSCGNIRRIEIHGKQIKSKYCK